MRPERTIFLSPHTGMLLLLVLGGLLLLSSCSPASVAQQPPATAPTAAPANAPQSQPTTVGAATKAPQSQATAAPPQAKPGSGGTVDPCALLTQAELAELVGNPVEKGEQEGPGTCSWDTEQAEQTSALLIVHAPGSLREQILCEDLRKGGGGGEALKGLGDVAVWEFSSITTIFNSGDLETCGPKGFLSLSLNGKRDEAALKQAALSIVNKVLARL